MKPFKTVDEQLDILKNRNLKFIDKEKAKQNLLTYGYYEIVNGYKTFLLDPETETEQFKSGETFEHLFALYKLDKNIKNTVLEASLEVELALRTAITYVIAEDFGEQQVDYLNRRNYRLGRRRRNSDRYPLEQVLAKFQNIISDNIEPYKHYRQQHGNVPPWILLKGTTLGNLVSFQKLLKPAQKEKVIAQVLNVPIELIDDNIKGLFNDMLDVILSFRNRSAHSGRIFNFSSGRKKMSYREFFHSSLNISLNEYNSGKGQSDLMVLLHILKWFKNQTARMMLEVGLFYYLKKHFEIYPSDIHLFSEGSKLPIELIEEKLNDD